MTEIDEQGNTISISPRSIWRKRIATIPEQIYDDSLLALANKSPYLANIPVAKKLCESRGNFVLPKIKPDLGIAGDSYPDTYSNGVQLIQQSIAMQQPILVALDYDCDGQTSGTCMYYTLKAAGANVSWIVPSRLEHGYGLNVELVKATGLQNALIVTTDNGITSVEEVAALKALGHMVVITDHHLQEGELPEADAIVNPKVMQLRTDDEYMAPGVYVAAKTALLSVKPLVSPEKFIELVEFCAPLVAIGIVSDVIELNTMLHNQLLYGLSLLHTTRHVGLNRLLEIAGAKPNQNITSTFIGFSLAPRLNAAGRMGQAELGVQLLLTEETNTEDEKKQVNALANKLNSLNNERKEISQQILDEAVSQVRELYPPEKDKDTAIYVLYKPYWHAGVIGIVAAMIAEQFHKPTIVLTKNKDSLDGSGRSVGNLDLFAILQECKDTLNHYGGHAAAVGVSLPEDKLEFFREQVNKVLLSKLQEDLVTLPVTQVDAQVTIADLENIHFRILCETFEPTGVLNPPLVFMLRHCLSTTWRERLWRVP